MDTDALLTYLQEKQVVPKDVTKISPEKCSHGQSNPTYILSLFSGDKLIRKLVFRRKPHGSLLPKAHQIDREFMLLEALHQQHFPVPQVFHYCKDERIVDTEFYVMEFVDGVIFRDPSLPELSPIQRRKTNFFQRQLHVWTKQYELASQLAPRIQEFEDLSRHLKNKSTHIIENELVLTHGDFRLDNVVFDPVTNAQFNGIPDETAFINMYGCQDRPETWSAFIGLSALRLASIAQGVYARSIQGNASAENASSARAVAVELSKVGIQEFERSTDSVSLFPSSQRSKQLLEKLVSFLNDCVYAAEEAFVSEIRASDDSWSMESQVIEGLKSEAKKRGLWNLFLPATSGLSQLEYAPLAEVMGRSLIAAEACNCSAPDTGNMELLHMYGTDKQKQQWLVPLLEGKIRSCFCMTEPDVASSDATNMQCTITRVGDHYQITGRKWWSTGAGSSRCKFAIVMGLTPSSSRPKHEQHSMVIVPLDSQGVHLVRPLTTFGYDDRPSGHFEIMFDAVRVPLENIIVGEGKGFEIAQGRLGPGRLHHCMRAIGMAERAFELMCARSLQRKAFGQRLAKHGMIQEKIALSRIEIDQSRLLVMQAARALDILGNKKARKLLSMAKVAIPRMAQLVVDRAIQVFGAAGLSSDVPLALMFAGARALRIADGPDEVHLLSIAKYELIDAAKQIPLSKL
eukprot:gene9968-2144_t